VGGGVGTNERGRWWKGVGRWIQCKKRVYMYVNAKMIPTETIPGMEGKGEWWKGWIQEWYIWYIVRTFVNAIVYPQPAQQ
jgi:hypothetical protein